MNVPQIKRQRKRGIRLDQIPSESLLENCEISSLVRLRTVNRDLLLAIEGWAKHVCEGKNWHRGDGLSSWVERLGRKVCVLNELSFVCLEDRKIRKVEETPTSTKRRIITRSQANFPPLLRDEGIRIIDSEQEEDLVVASFSPHGSCLQIEQAGRYFVCGQSEDSTIDTNRLVTNREKQRLICENRIPRLSFQVRVTEENKEASFLISSIYCGVATASWVRNRQARAQAVRTCDAWLLDLRRGRFVHAYPSYDRRVAALRGPNRARALASTDDVIRSNDILGIQVFKDSVLFYKNGNRLAFGCGGKPTELHDFQDDLYLRLGAETAGWGRALPQNEPLVPVLEIHARSSSRDDQRCRLQIEIAHWSGPATHYEHQWLAQKHAPSFSQCGPRFPPMAMSPARLRCRRHSQNIGISYLYEFWHRFLFALCRSPQTRAFVAALPSILGLLQLCLDLGALMSNDNHRILRSSFNAFALSVAVSSVWKMHFYDPRRPQRSRRGIRILLRLHFAKCVAIAAFVAFVIEPWLIHSHYELSACDSATITTAAWLTAELAFELSLQAATLIGACRRNYISQPLTTIGARLPPDNNFRISTTRISATNNIIRQAGNQPRAVTQTANLRTPEFSIAASLRNFPTGYDSAFTTASVIVQFFAMIFLVPGSAQIILAFWSDHVRTTPAPLLLPIMSNSILLNIQGLFLAITYPFVAAWWCFSVFLRFGLLVFGLHTLFGFEDFNTPGWLLG
mmetsp:Transcript_22437/g.29084  ORF Transcript_22437/g.29084 Transcript_22437/m.29084 type:complete len:738 (+) Transcript_22437:50-2263(+)